MSNHEFQCGRIAVVVFLIIWIILTIMAGISFTDFAESWPEWAPGPSPMLFAWVPYAFTAIGVLVLLYVLTGWVRKPSRTDDVQQHRTGAIAYEDVQSYGTQSSGYRDPKVSYQIQPFCNQCGAKLDSELVEWVGPLNYRCPSCGYTHKAETRYS